MDGLCSFRLTQAWRRRSSFYQKLRSDAFATLEDVLPFYQPFCFGTCTTKKRFPWLTCQSRWQLQYFLLEMIMVSTDILSVRELKPPSSARPFCLFGLKQLDFPWKDTGVHCTEAIFGTFGCTVGGIWHGRNPGRWTKRCRETVIVGSEETAASAALFRRRFSRWVSLGG